MDRGEHLSHIEKQLILYSKNHFRTFDYQHDLKYFAAELYGLGIDQVQQYSVVNMVIDLYQKLINLGYLEMNLKRFLNDIFRLVYRERNEQKASWDDVILHMLIEIQGMQVRNIKGLEDLELGKPDLSILSITTS